MQANNPATAILLLSIYYDISTSPESFPLFSGFEWSSVALWGTSHAASTT